MSIEAVTRFNYPGERQFYVVHSFDGIKEPLDPAGFKEVMELLLARIEQPFDYIISLDGPALLTGMMASIITNKPLRVAVKADLALPNQTGFIEPGGVNPLFLYDLGPSRVIVVDDEIRTGGTMLKCVEALSECDGIQVVAIVIPVGSTQFPLQQYFEKINIPLHIYVWHDN